MASTLTARVQSNGQVYTGRLTITGWFEYRDENGNWNQTDEFIATDLDSITAYEKYLDL